MAGGRGYTAAQRAAIAQAVQLRRFAVEIDPDGLALRYTAMSRPVVIDGNVYHQRAMNIPSGVPIDRPGEAKISIVIGNADLALTEHAYAELLSGVTMTLHLLVWHHTTHQWVRMWSLVWQTGSCDWDHESVRISAFGNAGHKPHAGLSEGSSSCWNTWRGVLCQYKGQQTWCNHSLARCQELDNESNFGGFPEAPDAGEVYQFDQATFSVGGPERHDDVFVPTTRKIPIKPGPYQDPRVLDDPAGRWRRWRQPSGRVGGGNTTTGGGGGGGNS